MSSPAQRYAAFRKQQAEDGPELTRFQALYEGHGVLVAAPTGSGKTVGGEFAVHLALAEGRKCFYTTPIKALSNQKYGYVVLDEVHYLADRFRGAVWEEVIIHLPESVRVVALSATVSNAEEFGDWLTQVRGGTAVIVDEHRPVPLWQHMLAGGRLYDLFVERPGDSGSTGAAQVNPELLRLARREGWEDRPGRGGRRPPRFRPRRRPSPRSRNGGRRTFPSQTSPCSATASGSPACSAASPPTTPACCPRSRKWWRSCSRPGWCGRSSRPKRWRSGSTCPLARSSSSGSTSGMATPMPR